MPSTSAAGKVLILTPVKDAAHHAETYLQGIRRLTYPHSLISLGVLESDSQDATYQMFDLLLAGSGLLASSPLLFLVARFAISGAARPRTPATFN